MSSDELQPSHPNNYNRSTRVASTAVTHRYVLMDRLRLGLSPPVDCIISHACNHTGTTPHHTTTILRPFFRDQPGEPVPKENFWTLWCKERLTEADTLAIRLGTTPSRLTSAYLHHRPHLFYRPDAFPDAHCPTNSIKALKATSTLGLGRRC